MAAHQCGRALRRQSGALRRVPRCACHRFRSVPEVQREHDGTYRDTTAVVLGSLDGCPFGPADGRQPVFPLCRQIGLYFEWRPAGMEAAGMEAAGDAGFLRLMILSTTELPNIDRRIAALR